MNLANYRKAHASITAPAPSFKTGLNINLQPESVGEFGTDKADVLLKFPTVMPEDFLSEVFFRNNSLFTTHQAIADHYFVHVTKSTPCPLIIDIDGSGNLYYSLHILVDEEVCGQVLVRKKGTHTVLSEEIRIISRRNSKLYLLGIQDTEKGDVYALRQALVEDDAELDICDVEIGGTYVKNEDAVRLVGKDSAANVQKVYAAHERQRYDFSPCVIHAHANTKSHIVTKGILCDESKANSQGSVKILPNAPHSEGYERQDALLLSDSAKAFAVPLLEIANHNVSCGHGSAIGKIDEEQLFYLMSRGIRHREAVRLIATGFLSSLLSSFDETTKDTLHARVEKMLP
ncbi:SufD family Fe-S cluster assembly protein [Candidatus Woesearchaeota archaeon]|nr:SufD family Fe-S cluster assembly protein [Candidatus Woesearchaeota archaeon]